MTRFSAVFFLSFTLLLSFGSDQPLCFGGILGLLGLEMTRWESQDEGSFYTPSRWLAFLIVFAIARGAAAFAVKDAK